MIKKYGKEIDMRDLNRNIESIKDLIENIKEISLDNLVKFDSSKEYRCRICLQSEYDLFFNVHGYQYCECRSCKSIFLANIPNTKKLYDGIPDSRVDIYIDEELFSKRVKMIAEPKVDFTLNAIKKLGFNIDQWLDIGCGTGEILYVLKSRGYSTIGIESDLREVNFARERNGLNILEAYVNSKDVNKEIRNIIKNSSVVSFFNVLEHIEQPEDFLDYIYKHMSNKSFLVFEVPKHPSLASFANLTSQGNIYRHIVPPAHLQIFSSQGIDLLLKDKFKLIATWGFGQGFFDILTNATLLSKIENLVLYEKLLGITNDVQRVLDENDLSDQMIFVAQKI